MDISTRKTNEKGKLVFKDVGTASKDALDKLGANDKLTVGLFVGIATRVIERRIPTGETYYGFSGSFKAIPSDEAQPVNEAGVAYLPESVFDGIADLLRDPEKPEVVRATEVRFAYSIGLRKDGKMAVAAVHEPEAVDSLATFVESLSVDPAPAPEAPANKGGKK